MDDHRLEGHILAFGTVLRVLVERAYAGDDAAREADLAAINEGIEQFYARKSVKDAGHLVLQTALEVAARAFESQPRSPRHDKRADQP